jgi:hypothetical protein
MLATIISILILVAWLALSISLTFKKREIAKKTGKPACCGGCSSCSGGSCSSCH